MWKVLLSSGSDTFAEALTFYVVCTVNPYKQTHSD